METAVALKLDQIDPFVILISTHVVTYSKTFDFLKSVSVRCLRVLWDIALGEDDGL